jgi:serine/threonine-protein kinase HipA
MAAPARLLVLLDGAVTGDVTRDSTGRLTFTYDDAWRRAADATPLSTSMPPQARTHRGALVDAFLWGLLPDNAQVLERWSRRYHVSARDAFGLLSTPIGRDCAGAIQLVSENDLDEARDPGRVEWLDEQDVADRLVELRRDATAWLPATSTGQFSLAGAQAKTALLRDPDTGRWGRPSGAAPTTHILKPAIPGLPSHDLNEHLCLEALRRLGLPAVRTTIETFGDELALVIARYDRAWVGNRWRRVHQEDLCQALGVHPTHKYQNEGGPSPEDVAAVLRRHVRPPVRAREAIERFRDALLVNWLLVGNDAHAKNYSLLLSGRQVRLAPLYDVASALPYDLYVPKLKLAMRIGGYYRLSQISGRQWRRFAEGVGLDGDDVVQRGLDLAQQLPDALADAVHDPTVERLGSALPAALLDGVSAHASSCADRLLRS